MVEVLSHVEETSRPILVAEQEVNLSIFSCEGYESDSGHHRLVVMGELVLGPVALPILWLDKWWSKILASDQLVRIYEAGEWMTELVLDIGTTSLSEQLHLRHVSLLE